MIYLLQIGTNIAFLDENYLKIIEISQNKKYILYFSSFELLYKPNKTLWLFYAFHENHLKS